MNRKNKIICLILVSFFFIAGIFAQTSLLAPTIPISNDFSTHSEEAAIKTSDVSGHYDYGDGNTMDIDAVDDTTTTTFTNTTSGEYLTIESENKDTSVSTTFNENATISSDLENIVKVEAVSDTNPLQKFGFSLTDKNQLYVESTCPVGHVIKIYTDAVLDDENDLLDSFYAKAVYDTAFINVTYLKDDPDGYNLNINPPGQDTHINYDEEANEYKWIDKTHGISFYTSEYSINNSGVWEDTIQVIDWSTPDLQTYSYKEVHPVYFVDIFQLNITKFYDTIVIHYSTFRAPGREGLETTLYQLVFTNVTGITPEHVTTGVITMDYELPGANMRLHWRSRLITVYFPVEGPGHAEVTFYLSSIITQLYAILMDYFSCGINKIWNDFRFFGLKILTGFSQTHVYIEIGSTWYSWMFQMGYMLDIVQKLFTDIEIIIRYLIWLYIFYVPTLILPNLLTINILEIVYNRKSLDIIIKVTEQFGFNIAGAIITGTWDGASIGTVIDNGDGTYSFTLPAKGRFTLTLSLTASMTGFANGILNVEITVESPGGGSKTSKGLSEKDFLGLYLLAIVSTIATVFIGKYFSLPKTLGITKYFNKKKYQRSKL